MTEEAREIARKMLRGQKTQYDIVLGGEIMVTEAIEPPKKYHKETKEAWNNLMKLLIDHGALNQREMPQFRIMFDNLDYYFTASETIENVTAGKEGKGRPADIYGGLREVMAARDTFARNFQEYAKIFDKHSFRPVTEEDLRDYAVDDFAWREFVEEHDAEEWEAYKEYYRQNREEEL